MKGWGNLNQLLASVVFLLLLLVLVPGFAVAEPEKLVQIQTELGWQGKVVPHRYAPAVVHIKNTSGSDLTGIIEAVNYERSVPPTSAGQATKQPTRYFPFASFGEKVSLPGGSDKKVILWYPSHGAGERVDFVFRSGNNELARVTQKVPGAAPTGPMPGGVGVLGEIPPALERVRVVMSDGVPRVPAVLQLTSDLFPRRGAELNAFQTILVTGSGASALNDEQRQALVDWVQFGGQLVVGGGLAIDEALAVLPGDLVPVTVGSISQRDVWASAARWLEVDAPGSGPTPVASLSGAGEPWGPPEAPLGVRLALGGGSVMVLGFDPGQNPWRAGALGEGLWQKILTLSEPDERGYPSYLSDGGLGNIVHMINSLPAEAFPGWRPVGLFLLVFMLLVGPGVYLLLRRWQRPEYTWLAVPLLSVLFAGSVYLYMIWTGGDVLINVVQVVDIRDHGQPAQYTAVGYFAPTKSIYEASLEDPDRSVEVSGMGWRSVELKQEDDDPPYSVIRGSDLTVRFSADSQWNMRGLAFRTHQVAKTDQGLTASIEIQGDKIRGQVHNNTGLHLDHVTFLIGSEYKGVGDLKPNRSAEIEMKVTPPQYSSQDRSGLQYASSHQIFLYPQGPPPSPKPGVAAPPSRRLDSEEQRRASLMDNWMHNFMPHGPVQTVWPLTILAWSNSPHGELGIKNNRQDPYYLSMFVLKPELKLLSGSFTIPAGLIAPEVSIYSNQGIHNYNNLVGLEGGSLLFKFKPELAPDAHLNQITLNFNYFPAQGSGKQGMGSPAPSPTAVPEGVLAVYHPGRGDWQPLVGTSPFKLPGDMATATGEVRVQVLGGDPAQGKGFYFLPPTVAYGGEKT